MRGIWSGEVEGFLAAAVAGEKEGVIFGIVNGEGEHAVEFRGEGGAPFKIGGGEDFGIAAGVKLVAELFEFFAEFAPVVDFAIANGVEVLIGRGEGLGSMLGVEDGEAGHAEGEMGGMMVPGAVRSSVSEGAEHFPQAIWGEMKATCNAAHLIRVC